MFNRFKAWRSDRKIRKLLDEAERIDHGVEVARVRRRVADRMAKGISDDKVKLQRERLVRQERQVDDSDGLLSAAIVASAWASTNDTSSSYHSSDSHDYSGGGGDFGGGGSSGSWD
jgi:uncharacterized membrane protein YgcG